MPVANQQLLEMLRRMFRIRLFEEKVAALKAKAQLPGAAHLSIGQEAEIVGSCMALRDDDYMTGNHRSHGHPIGKGASLGPLMAELYGRQNGVCRGKGGSMHLADFSKGSLGESGIVGGLLPTAVGAALSAQMRGTDQVCLCFFGDGAVNEGTFHESMNLASVWKVPVIFLCENNGYAMFTAAAQMTAIASIVDRAQAYEMPGETVDGQDVLAVHASVSKAVERARAGGGPTLVEARTYRFHDHSEFGRMNLPTYRSAEELDTWRQRDPLTLFGARLQVMHQLDAAGLERIRNEVANEVDAAVKFAEAGAMPPPEALFEHVYA